MFCNKRFYKLDYVQQDEGQMVWAVGTNARHHNVELWWKPGFASGQSAVAVTRKIRRAARQLGLRVNRWGGPNVTVTTHRDLTRLAELLKFCNGRSLAATAANNWGRR